MKIDAPIVARSVRRGGSWLVLGPAAGEGVGPAGRGGTAGVGSG